MIRELLISIYNTAILIVVIFSQYQGESFPKNLSCNSNFYDKKRADTNNTSDILQVLLKKSVSKRKQEIVGEFQNLALLEKT